jgi:hypothetical protein
MLSLKKRILAKEGQAPPTQGEGFGEGHKKVTAYKFSKIIPKYSPENAKLILQKPTNSRQWIKKRLSFASVPAM